MYYLTVSPEAQKCHMGLTGLNSRCQQGCIPFWKIPSSFSKENLFLVFLSFLKPHIPCVMAPFFHLQTQQHCIFLTPLLGFINSLTTARKGLWCFLFACLFVLIFSILFPVQLTCSVALVSGVQ